MSWQPKNIVIYSLLIALLIYGIVGCDSADKSLAKAKALENQKSYFEAKNIYRDIIARYPESPEAEEAQKRIVAIDELLAAKKRIAVEAEQAKIEAEQKKKAEEKVKREAAEVKRAAEYERRTAWKEPGTLVMNVSGFSSGFDIGDMGFKREGGLRYIVGTLTSGYGKSYSYVSITFQLQDLDGIVVGTAMVNIGHLGARTTWRYKALVLESNAKIAKLADITATPSF